MVQSAGVRRCVGWFFGVAERTKTVFKHLDVLGWYNIYVNWFSVGIRSYRFAVDFVEAHGYGKRNTTSITMLESMVTLNLESASNSC